MKLLHIISSLEIGGAQRLLADLLPIQKEQGIDVSLLVYERIDNAFTRQVEDAGVPIISLNQSNYKSIYNIRVIRQFIRNYDIVHVHLFPSLYWVAIASIGLKHIKLVWTEHSTSNQRRGKWYLRPIEKWIYRHYDCIISISQQTQDALQQWIQSKDKRFHVVCNGIDTTIFKKISTRVIPKSIIMVSRFVPAKDQETVIRAMKFIDKKATLRFVGDGETMKKCQILAHNLGVDNRIDFMGAKTNVAYLIAESYIGIQSSHWEGFGLTAVEMMASGKPTIASDVDGLKQVVDGAGVIFKEGNAKQLAEITNRLLSDNQYYQQIAQRCAKRAQQYDIHNMANQYTQQYKRIYNNA